MSIHKYKTKSGDGYRALIRVGRRQQSKCFARKEDARQWEARQLQRSRLTTTQALLRPNMTMSELASYWLENYAKLHKEVSAQIWDEGFLRRHVLADFGKVKIADLDASQIEAWMARLHRDEHISAKTVNNGLGLLRKMLNDAVRWKFITQNPLLAVPRIKVPEQTFDFWNADEADTFLTYLRDHSPEHHPAICLALHTGLRRGEIQALQWDSVDLARKQIVVKRSYCRHERKIKETTKSKRVRHVPISGVLCEVLIELKRSSFSSLVLPGIDFEHMYRTIAKLAPRAGVKTIRFHDLRHSFASIYMMQGGNLYKLQRMLGHSTIQMTERYSHMSPQHLIGETDGFLFGGKSAEESLVVNLAEWRQKI